MKYESVTQNVLFSLQLILQNDKQIPHALFSWHIKFENYMPRKPRPII
jgi:hypothetical protein